MKKQFLTIGALFFLAVTAWVILASTPVQVTNTIPPKCKNTCESMPQPHPQTGFFIFDSFSGNL